MPTTTVNLASLSKTVSADRVRTDAEACQKYEVDGVTTVSETQGVIREIEHRLRHLVMGQPFCPVIFAQVWPVIAVGLVHYLPFRVGENRQGADIDPFFNIEFAHQLEDIPRSPRIDSLR